MTTTDEALLWARERCAQQMPSSTEGFTSGKFDHAMHLRNRAEAYRAGQQSADERVAEMHQYATNLLADLNAARAKISRLRDIVVSYGDPVLIASVHRPDWQQEIDEAFNREPGA